MNIPQPCLFTTGSRWRFDHSRTLPYGHFRAGDEFVVRAYDNATKVIAASGCVVGSYCRHSDANKYLSSRTVSGTLKYGDIARHVERVEAGVSKIYYIAREGSYASYYKGIPLNDPIVMRFSDAKYWESRYFALKALYRLNRRGTWRNPILTGLYTLVEYDTLTDQHCTVQLTSKVLEALSWISQNVYMGGGDQGPDAVAARLVLKDIEAFDGLRILRVPVGRLPAVLQMSERAGINIKTVDRWQSRDAHAFFGSIDDAILVKMSVPEVELLEIGC